MLIFLCQGGESTIVVYGPSGASVQASGGGEEFTGLTIPSSGELSINVHTIASWTVQCRRTSSDSWTTNTVSITSFGQSKDTHFSFAVINVYTHPGASITAFKSGSSLGPYTANSSGYYQIPVPAESLNSTAWTVRATDANAQAVIEDKTCTTNSYTANPTVYPLYRIPIIKVSWSGGSATSYGNGMDNGYATVSGTNSWKMWVKASCTVTFLWIKTKVHFWGIGKGGNGSGAFYDLDSASPYGGGSGGGGGQVKTESNVTVSNSGYTVTIGSATSFGGVMSCNAGGNGSQMSGGLSGGNSGNGSSGEWVNDHSYPQSSGGGGSGGEGVYAFNDSSFDGVRYGHGGGGGAHSSSTPGYHSTTAGSGGGGAGHSGNSGRTDGNYGIFCLKPGDNI